MLNPANTDSQGLTQLTEQIETRKKKNDITQDTKILLKIKI